MDNTKLFLDRCLALSRKVFVQFGRLYLTIITLIGKENFRKIINANRNIFVDMLEDMGDDFPIAKKDLLRFLMIKKQQYSFVYHIESLLVPNH